MKISKSSRVVGKVALPGDKSISHRAAMFASLAAGETRIDNFASSADCASTIACFERLGVGFRKDGRSVRVYGRGIAGLRAPSSTLDCGNSGTTMRLMAGILAGQPFDSVMTGDESLSSRPMKRVIEPLALMNARIESNDGRAPLHVFGKKPLKAIAFEPTVASAQVKSCVLLAGLFANGTTSVLERTQTRDHTERMLRWFGVDVRETLSDDGNLIEIDGGSRLKARDLVVPSDVSSAAFFLVAAAALDGSDLTLPNVGLNPSRDAIVRVLREFGTDISITNQRESGNEPVADLRVRGGLGERAGGNVLKGKIIANLIDEVPILAVLGTRLTGGIEIREAGELRVKESDRIRSVVDNLRRMGAEVEEFEDGLRVEKSALKGSRIDSFGDHRIAMAFAVAGLFAEGDTEIDGAECAAVSFPAFFESLRDVTE